MINKQRTTNQQIALQNILNYKISQPNKTKFDNFLNKTFNAESPLFSKLKNGLEKGPMEKDSIEEEPILTVSILKRSFKQRPQRVKSCLLLNTPKKTLSCQTEETKENSKKKSVKVVRSLKRRKNKFVTSSQDNIQTKRNVHCVNFINHSQPNYHTIQQKNKQIMIQKYYSQPQKRFRTPNNLSRDKLRKMLFVCPTDPVTKHKKKTILDPLARKRSYLQKNCVSERLRFNGKVTTNSSNLIHRNRSKKDLFEQMILINKNGNNNINNNNINNGKNYNHNQRPTNKNNCLVSNRHKPQLIFKRPKPKKNFVKKKTQINLQNKIFYNDPKSKHVIETIPQPNLKKQILKKNSNSPSKVELFNYNPNSPSPMKRNKRSLFRNPLNFTFKKPIPVKRNNQKEKECKNSQINLGIVSQGKTEANFPKDRENENEKYMIRNEKNQVQGKTIQKEKSNNKNSQRKTNLINDNNNQNLNLNNKKNIVVTYQKNINYEIEKKKHQRPKLEITLNEIEKESHNPNENENKDTKEIQKGKGEEKGKGKGKGNLVQNQNNSISNTENNHTNIHNNPNIQSWNKLSKFENFVKDRKMSLEFPEFFQKIEGNKSFYDYYLKNAFNNNPLKKKNILKKNPKIPKKLLIRLAKNPLKYTYSIDKSKLIIN
ncbi:hypothetical protein M0813_10815 [Anaeramoeba flamelloides]|uniref:Uncharacterized protein n=1 Tax=Anaeramoeba flamelloides TaxID=1746091 RepID=A0ABQ8X231_9EUKA|nr:hypothetical protein M0813_10815 [Anaeramoeba flamelloides]